MAKTLVWVTHSFRADSRLTSMLSGDCTFVYYSPWHFAGLRERNIYQNCSIENLDAFYFSINAFNSFLQSKGGKIHVFRESDVVAHINNLVAKHGFTHLVIDQPQFAFWHSVNLDNIASRVKISKIDSDLVDASCFKMTAKSRWTTHIQHLNTFKPHAWNPQINAQALQGYSDYVYPAAQQPDLLNISKINARLDQVVYTYGETRDRHDGQTRLSTALHNGVIDPTNTFFAIANRFKNRGINPALLDGPAAAILRQLAFREISILQARRHNLTLEDEPIVWAQRLMHIDAYNNMVSIKPNPTSNVTWQTVSAAKTGDKDLDFLLSELKSTGIMPNRARMWFASKIFYESHTGLDALTTLINTFDLLGLDGQSPNNYTQCCNALGLTYGKVLKMNRDNAFKLLKY